MREGSAQKLVARDTRRQSSQISGDLGGSFETTTTPCRAISGLVDKMMRAQSVLLVTVKHTNTNCLSRVHLKCRLAPRRRHKTTTSGWAGKSKAAATCLSGKISLPASQLEQTTTMGVALLLREDRKHLIGLAIIRFARSISLTLCVSRSAH